jgi:hypothetical protein
MPKPIQRKVGGEENLPPVPRSALSLKLESMAAKQKADFAAISPEAAKLHAAMRDSERYEALTNEESGLIFQLKREAKKTSFRMACAVENYKNISAGFAPFEGNLAGACSANPKLVQELWLCTMSLATIGRELAGQVDKIISYEQEAEVLGARIMDDSNLPNFAKLDEGRDEKVDELVSKSLESIEADLGGDRSDAMAGEKVPEDAQPQPFSDDRPLRWESWYEIGDKVIAPTKEGAQAMVAMRIRKTLKNDQIRVWQVDEKGDRICHHEFDTDGGPCRRCGAQGGLLTPKGDAG